MTSREQRAIAYGHERYRSRSKRVDRLSGSLMAVCFGRVPSRRVSRKGKRSGARARPQVSRTMISSSAGQPIPLPRQSVRRHRRSERPALGISQRLVVEEARCLPAWTIGSAVPRATLVCCASTGFSLSQRVRPKSMVQWIRRCPQRAR